MNPGPVEEIGKATNVFMQIMKDQPLSLALVVMNILLLSLFFYVIQTATSVRHQEMERVFAAQEKTNQLLFNCIPANRGSLTFDRRATFNPKGKTGEVPAEPQKEE